MIRAIRIRIWLARVMKRAIRSWCVRQEDKIFDHATLRPKYNGPIGNRRWRVVMAVRALIGDELSGFR